MSRASTLDSDELQLRILISLDKNGSIPDTREFDLGEENVAGQDPVEQAAIKSALDSLNGREMLTYEIHIKEIWLLSEEGNEIAEKGSPEYRVWQECVGEGSSMSKLQVSLFHLGWNCRLMGGTLL